MDSKIFNIGDRVAVLDDDMQGIVVNNDNAIQIEDENGFLYSFNAEDIIKVGGDLLEKITVKPKAKISRKASKVSKIKKQQQLEIDLHIHQITHSNAYMSNSDMLQKQMAVVKMKLEYAMKNYIQKVVFIHGVGQGVLKKELIKFLQKYPIEINDASYRKYGRGATEVYIYKSKISK